jgi:Uma2 family endonuclease
VSTAASAPSSQGRLASEEVYLLEELSRAVRHEYLGGVAYAMSEASAHHNLIAGNLYVALRQHYKPLGCRVFQESMKVRIPWGDQPYYYYPDGMVCCEENDRGDEYDCERPCILIEVLSDSTARIDRVEKLQAYQQLPSLRHYIIVSQQTSHVIWHQRALQWKGEFITDAKRAITLDCGDSHPAITLDLATIYDGVLPG